MSNNLVNKHLYSGNEFMSLEDFTELASYGETNLVERKSIKILSDFRSNKNKIKEKLSQAMSAFGNHSGGFMLFGVDDDGNIEEGIDNKIGNTTIKEWFEDVLWTCCSPPFKDYSAKVVKNDTKFLFAIVFGESSTAPNQANYGEYKNKYYSRIDGKSKPIDGILVKDIFSRKEFADLEIEIDLIKIENNSQSKAKLELALINKSRVAAEKVVVLMNISQELINGGVHTTNIDYLKDRGQFNSDIIYPDIRHDIVGREKINLKDFDEFKIHFTIVAKNMLKKETEYIVRDISKTTPPKEPTKLAGRNPEMSFAILKVQ
ncbi:MAG: ATP-binding protein [Bacteroidales bacterium]|nr:ATP-binding protein [Bacteroidales bacterium]